MEIYLSRWGPSHVAMTITRKSLPGFLRAGNTLVSSCAPPPTESLTRLTSSYVHFALALLSTTTCLEVQ